MFHIIDTTYEFIFDRLQFTKSHKIYNKGKYIKENKCIKHTQCREQLSQTLFLK